MPGPRDCPLMKCPTHQPPGAPNREPNLLRDTNMSLLDIDDFSMRSKVAQLMAVVPALAVIDL
jgi:hypothetical protein